MADPRGIMAVAAETFVQQQSHDWDEAFQLELVPELGQAAMQTIEPDLFNAILAHKTTIYEPVLLVTETAQDELVRRRAAKFIGACALDQVVAPPESSVVRPTESLLDALQLAYQGDPVARKMVETNVATDVIERTIKTGHVIAVDLMVDAAGKIQQFGQTMESVQANSLRHTASTWQMRERTEAETVNSFRIESEFRSGNLEEYNFVVVSRAADNMNLKQMAKQGFFTETMSCAIQVTGANGNHLVTESAFVSGIAAPGKERHDQQTVVALYAQLGVDVAEKSAAEIIATPLLVHKSLMPNGVVDIVKLYDAAAGGTFFGEDKPAEDYVTYRETCRSREKAFQPKIQEIVTQLVAQAPTITSKVQASRLLAKISEDKMVEHAVADTTIDLRVFQARSAQHIIKSRRCFEVGDYYGAQVELTLAKRTAQTSSCPGEVSSEDDTDSSNSLSNTSDEDCEFTSKECPICGQKNVKTTMTKTEIKGDCGCSVKRDRPAPSPLQNSYALAA